MINKRICPYCLVVVALLPCRAQVFRDGSDTSYTPTQQFNPGTQRDVTLSDDTVQATLVKANGGLYIESQWGKDKSRTKLPVEVGQVDWISRGANNRLVIKAMVNGSGSEVVIIDSQGRILDKLLCYLPSLSPDGRYIAFIKFYPTHFAEGPTDKYMLYEISKSPGENRQSEVPLLDWVSVGKTIFPPREGHIPGDNLNQDDAVQHFSASGFFWAPDSKECVFLDRTASGYQLIKVVIQERGGLSLATGEVPALSLCSASPGTKGALETCQILMRNVVFRSENNVLSLEFQIVPNRKYILEFNDSDFHGL